MTNENPFILQSRPVMRANGTIDHDSIQYLDLRSVAHVGNLDREILTSATLVDSELVADPTNFFNVYLENGKELSIYPNQYSREKFTCPRQDFIKAWLKAKELEWKTNANRTSS